MGGRQREQRHGEGQRHVGKAHRGQVEGIEPQVLTPDEGVEEPVPIIEPEVDIKAADKAAIETTLKQGLLERLDKLASRDSDA